MVKMVSINIVYSLNMDKIPSQLLPLVLPQAEFRERFVHLKRYQDPFGRSYDICEDMQDNRRRVALKDYLTSTTQQLENVLLNLTAFRDKSDAECLCNLKVFCQTDGSQQILAIFEYDGQSLQELVAQNQYLSQRYQFYQTLMEELIGTVLTFSQLNIQIEDLIPSNILVNSHGKQLTIKIFFDERDKSFDRVRQGQKIFSSPLKIQNSLRQTELQIQDSNSAQIVFEIGLLMLDLIYEYEVTSSAKNGSGKQLSLNLLKQSYLCFNQDRVDLNGGLIQHKIAFLKDQKSSLLSVTVSVISKMIQSSQNRTSLKQILKEVHNIRLVRQQEVHFQLTQQVILSQKQGLQRSDKKGDDSLKYSQASIAHIQHPSARTIQTKTARNIVYQSSNKISSDKFIEMEREIWEKLAELGQPQPIIQQKLQLQIKRLRDTSITRKDYYDHSTYYGEIDNQTQKRHGQGIYLYYQGDIYFGRWDTNQLMHGTYIFKKGECFEGTVHKGKQGWGTYYYTNGSVFEGQWKDDLKEGNGTMHYQNGQVYEGTWSQGKKHGEGIYRYLNNTTYQGGFLNGKRAGVGVITFPDGTRIEACWSTNWVEGKGRIYYSNGNVYEGFFECSQKQGSGVYSWGDSTMYDGQFKHDKIEGQGVIKYPEGETYQGRMVQGKREGKGCYRYQNGDEFIGEWKADEKIRGQYRFADGRTFEGKFRNSSICEGVMVYSNGESYEGEFQNGERCGSGTYRAAEGGIIYEGLWERDKFKQSA